MRTIPLIALALCLLLVTGLFAGPVSSGAILLLLPSHLPTTDTGTAESDAPRHNGHINLAVGSYTRVNEDLVVPGTPRLALRRTYLSSYRASKQFGVGTTHDGEWYLVGDGRKFQWARLVRTGSSWVTFDRTSSGTSSLNAMFKHRATAGEWQGARLGWTGLGWALRRFDGSLLRFRHCGPDENSVCSVVHERDAAGRGISYERDPTGRLTRMQASRERWIAFDYDGQSRITRAHDSTKREVRYTYDDRGRLLLVASSDGIIHGYTYTDRDEMATIVEPGTDIENSYDENGRCIRQVNRYSDGSEPFVFDFTYRVQAASVVQTDIRRSNGTWTQYTFNTNGFTTSERWGRADVALVSLTYELDPTSNAVRALSLTCPDRSGRPLRHSSLVRPGEEEWVKEDLAATHCSWTGRRPHKAAVRLRTPVPDTGR